MEKEAVTTSEKSFLDEPTGKNIFDVDAEDEGPDEGQDEGDGGAEDAPTEPETPEDAGEKKPEETREPEKLKALVPESQASLLPAHFTAEGKAAFDKLISGKADAKEAPVLMAQLAREVATTERNRTALIDKHVGEVMKLKSVANDPSNVAALDYLSQNPDARETVAQFLLEHQKAKQGGSKDALGDARKVLGGGQAPAEDVFTRLGKLKGMTPEARQDALISNPEILSDLIDGLFAAREETKSAQGKVSEALQPIQALSKEAKASQSDLETFQRLVSDLPEDWRTSPETINELDAILKAHGPQWKESGKTIEQVFEKAVDRLHGVLEAKRAREQGAQAEQDKAKTARLKRLGVHGDSRGPRPGVKESWDDGETSKEVFG